MRNVAHMWIIIAYALGYLLTLCNCGCETTNSTDMTETKTKYISVLMNDDSDYLVDNSGRRLEAGLGETKVRQWKRRLYALTPQQLEQVRVTEPPKSQVFDKTLILAIYTDPSGARVFDKNLVFELGKTPLEIPIKFCEWDGVFWFKDPGKLGGKVWYAGAQSASVNRESTLVRYSTDLPSGEGHEVKFLLKHQGYYALYVNWGFEVKLNKDNLKQGIVSTFPKQELHDRCKLTAMIRLLPHGQAFTQQIVDAIDRGDYYGAEELRISRIIQLEDRLESNRHNRGVETAITEIHRRLVVSELDQLKHTVGLLDPQIMALRKQLLTELREGDVDAALAIAKTIESMEKKYFPPKPPKTVVVQAPTQKYVRQRQQTQHSQPSGKQEIVIQQKPYYGVTNIVQALGAIRGSKITPEAYQRAFGTAQLLDIMGFGAGLLNK